MILLDEAVDRFAAAAAPYGVRPRRWSLLADPSRWIRSIEAAVAPLVVPAELRAFWLGWDPRSMPEPVLEGFIPIQAVLAERALEHPPGPAVLLPIANAAHARIWIELGTEDHPGGRIFHSHHDETEVTLFAFGVSGLFETLSAVFECDGIDDRTGALDPEVVDFVVGRSLDRLLPNGAPRRFEGIDRSRQPAHWRRAEGIDGHHFALRGPTHTVESLDRARHDVPVTATLVGEYRDVVGGGPLNGTVGMFRDHTGSVQVFVPRQIALRGAVGHDGQVEVDVLALGVAGTSADALPAKRALEELGTRGALSAPTEVFERLVDQIGELDTSVIVTAMRPVR